MREEFDITMKIKTDKLYGYIAFTAMAVYLIFIFLRTSYLWNAVGKEAYFTILGYVISSSAPVFVSLEALIFAVHAIMELSKLKTSFPKGRAMLDIIFGGVGLFVLCLYIGIKVGPLSGADVYPFAARIRTGGMIAICLYWITNIIVNIKIQLSEKKK